MILVDDMAVLAMFALGAALASPAGQAMLRRTADSTAELLDEIEEYVRPKLHLVPDPPSEPKPAPKPVPLPIPFPRTKEKCRDDEEQRRCPCCGGPVHSAAQRRNVALTENQYYLPLQGTRREPGFVKDAAELLRKIRASECKDLLPPSPPATGPCYRHYITTPLENKAARAQFDEFRRGRPGQWAHRVPLSGGGCPIGEGNLSRVLAKCKGFEEELGKLQDRVIRYHRTHQLPSITWSPDCD